VVLKSWFVNQQLDVLRDISSVIAYCDALGGLAVSVLATEPTGYSVAGSSPTEDGGFLRVIKIPSAHFLRMGSKAVGPMS
jgi:hypothetical protein